MQAQVNALEAALNKLQCQDGCEAVIAFLLTIYVAVVVLLFKLKLVKPQPYPIAIVVVAGLFVIGGPAVAWTLCAR